MGISRAHLAVHEAHGARAAALDRHDDRLRHQIVLLDDRLDRAREDVVPLFRFSWVLR
jgi:hypothetical protein